ncbi:MAG: DEAD/DEAH box helicase family protein [Succinimonas sp.]|nr:DEAD/DEAH box helicase family protein [Succinimonas sp.]
MLQEVKELQNKAVREMLVKIDSSCQEFTFKSPTGSGKTFMMARFMNEYLAKNHNAVFIVSSLSKAKLAEQNYNKFQEYEDKGLVKYLNSFLINSDNSGENALYIPTDYNVYVLPRDLYKDKSKLKGQGAFKHFLTELKKLKKQIFLIKDECHIATSNLDELVKDKNDEHKYFNKVINISATPKGKVDVELLEIDAINAKLIKSVEYRTTVNEKSCSFEQGGVQYEYLNNALREFLKIKSKYQELKINPCFIIQISNKDEGDQQFNTIKYLLNSPSYSHLKWMSVAQKPSLCDTNDIIIKGNKQNWEKYVIKNESLIDVLIFKMMITEGWDIPRACMLFQIRDSKSKQLDEQVLGRIRRNPKLVEFEKLSKDEQELVTKAYVWGIRPDSMTQKQIDVKLKDLTLSDDLFDTTSIQNEMQLKITKLKDNLETIDNEFDFSTFLKTGETTLGIGGRSIFELYESLEKANNKIQDECWKYVENHSLVKAEKYSDWFSFTSHIDEVQKQIKSMLRSYESSIEIIHDSADNPIEVSFPFNSCYSKNDSYQLQLSKWVWVNDDKYSNFSFDSEAEREWIHILLDNDCMDKIKEIRGVLMIGKNFLPNSNLRYQYYSDGLHYSYPDFILKNKRDEYFIFEVKSFNKSSKLNIDETDYINKVEELMKFYEQVSKVLADYYFCFPIKDGDTWNVHYYKSGKHTKVGLSNFVNIL